MTRIEAIVKSAKCTIAIFLLVCAAVRAPFVLADPVDLAMTRAESGNFYVHALLGENVQSDMLLDTGAGYVSLTRSTFRSLADGIEPRFSRYIYGAMANGKVEKISLYFLDELKLADNCVLHGLEVALLPNADQDILGLNALSLMEPFTMQFSNARLTSQGCSS